MFNTLYRYPRVVARHCEGPSAPERERFLIHCSNEGMAQGTLLHLASEMLVIARRINIEGGRFVDAEEVEAAADLWVRYQHRYHRIRGSRFSRERFIQTATAWLRFLGQLQPLNEKPLIYADLINEFARYMREERGLSLRTIQSRCWHVRAFLNWLSEEAVDLAELRLEQIDAFLALKSKQGWCRVRCIPYKNGTQATVPYLDKSEIDALLAAPDRSTTQGCHDYALLLFLYNSGARASEAAQLTIDHFDFGGGSVSILGKGRKQRQCPLWPATVQALSVLVGQRHQQVDMVGHQHVSVNGAVPIGSRFM